jgi:hypothetical protein
MMNQSLGTCPNFGVHFTPHVTDNLTPVLMNKDAYGSASKLQMATEWQPEHNFEARNKKIALWRFI